MNAAEAGALSGVRLGTKLVIAIAVLTALLATFLLGYVGPSTAARFAQRSSDLVERSSKAMQALATKQAEEADSVLVELIAHTTSARQRAFQDLPLELYADPEQLRAAVREADDERGTKLRSNAELLAQETRRRADARIADALKQLRTEQRTLVDEMTGQLRTTHLLLCAAFVSIVTAALGLGLWRLVVIPIGALRSATRRVAHGDLDSPVGIPTLHTRRGRDEIGALAADFSTMVQRLRESRAQLDSLNTSLEQQVAEKTRELARAEKMAWIGTLAGGVAHEFNNLIGGIRGCASEARIDETDPERRETFDVILRAADRGGAITAQLLQFARSGAGGDAQGDARVDLATILDDVLALLEPDARRRGVTIANETSRNLHVLCNADAMHQVFVNLVTNALQAMPDGGALTLRSSREGNNAAIAVTDDGVGIATADLDRIFEPFFSRRADERDPNQRGTGLGLAVSFGIVESHGGTIRVVSTPGDGSTFTVELPTS